MYRCAAGHERTTGSTDTSLHLTQMTCSNLLMFHNVELASCVGEVNLRTYHFLKTIHGGENSNLKMKAPLSRVDNYNQTRFMLIFLKTQHKRLTGATMCFSSGERFIHVRLFFSQVSQCFAPFLLNLSPNCSLTTTCCVGYVWSRKMQRSAPRWHSSCWTARDRRGKKSSLYYIQFIDSFHDSSGQETGVHFFNLLDALSLLGIGVVVGNHAASWLWRSWVHLWGSCITSPAASLKPPCWR